MIQLLPASLLPKWIPLAGTNRFTDSEEGAKMTVIGASGTESVTDDLGRKFSACILANPLNHNH